MATLTVEWVSGDIAVGATTTTIATDYCNDIRSVVEDGLTHRGADHLAGHSDRGCH